MVFGNSELHDAAGEEYELDRLKELIKNGADLEAKNDYSETPLFYAVRTCELEPVKILVEAGADINAKGQFKNSLLHQAVSSGALATIEYLLEKGLDPNYQNESKDTPWHTAAKLSSTYYDKAAQHLKKYGADPTIKNWKDMTPEEFREFRNS